jgi:hypothetical protein
MDQAMVRAMNLDWRPDAVKSLLLVADAPPAIDCYLVTRLDALVRRVIDSQISGRRIEPDDGEVMRSVGKYDAGKCVLPSGFDQQS